VSAALIRLVSSIFRSPFATSVEERERCYSFVLSRTPHKINNNIIIGEIRRKYKLELLTTELPNLDRIKFLKAPQAQGGPFVTDRIV
jgi:hypothetical protein